MDGYCQLYSAASAEELACRLLAGRPAGWPVGRPAGPLAAESGAVGLRITSHCFLGRVLGRCATYCVTALAPPGVDVSLVGVVRHRRLLTTIVGHSFGVCIYCSVLDCICRQCSVEGPVPIYSRGSGASQQRC